VSRTLNALALTLLIPAALAAQHPQTRQGFGIGFGFGAGSAGFCDGCDDQGGTELSGYLRLGGYLNPSLFLAGETNGWMGSQIDTPSSLGAIMGVVQWYPMVERGLYLKGGVGYSYANASDGSDISTSGLAVSVGAGYDFRVARNFALTPYINYLQQLGGQYAYAGGEDTGPDAKVHLFQFGLGLTWF
jgi:hypothetical protein